MHTVNIVFHFREFNQNNPCSSPGLCNLILSTYDPVYLLTAISTACYGASIRHTVAMYTTLTVIF